MTAMQEAADPIINALNRPYWEAAARGELALPHCTATGIPFWPPSPISPVAEAGVAWREVAPFGEVTAIVTYRRAFQTAFAGRLPYGIALVELAGGVRLQAHVLDPDAAQAPRPGDSVRLRFDVAPGGGPLLVAQRENSPL